MALIKRGYPVQVFERDLTAIRGEGKYRGPIQVLPPGLLGKWLRQCSSRICNGAATADVQEADMSFTRFASNCHAGRDNMPDISKRMLPQIQSNALAALEAIDEGLAEKVLAEGCVTGDRINGLCDGVTGDWCASHRSNALQHPAPCILGTLCVKMAKQWSLLWKQHVCALHGVPTAVGLVLDLPAAMARLRLQQDLLSPRAQLAASNGPLSMSFSPARVVSYRVLQS